MINRILKLTRRISAHLTPKMNNIWFYFFESKVECNICGYKANRLASDFWHQYASCPICRSGVRQRLLWAMLEHLENFGLSKIVQDKKVLHFAPEKVLGSLIEEHAGSYETADYMAEGYAYDSIDHDVDISDMACFESNSFDCVIACDVLEHVVDDDRGIQEVYRVLQRGGHCMFTVPQRDNLQHTYEDLSITEPAARKEAFGQADHLRIYGQDFVSKMEASGFQVTAVDETFFPSDIVARFVLFPPILSTRDNVTNFRKVFVGFKV